MTMTRGEADKHDRVISREQDEAIIYHQLTSEASKGR
jgi:hypothetical protein